MTEFEQTILERLENLESEVRALRVSNSRLADDLPPDAVVGKDYVAHRFGITERAVMRGEQGTHKIRRVSGKPLKFIKKEVDAAWREKSKSPKEKAQELRQKTKTRRYSVIGKTAENLKV